MLARLSPASGRNLSTDVTVFLLGKLPLSSLSSLRPETRKHILIQSLDMLTHENISSFNTQSSSCQFVRMSVLIVLCPSCSFCRNGSKVQIELRHLTDQLLSSLRQIVSERDRKV